MLLKMTIKTENYPFEYYLSKSLKVSDIKFISDIKINVLIIHVFKANNYKYK